MWLTFAISARLEGRVVGGIGGGRRRLVVARLRLGVVTPQDLRVYGAHWHRMKENPRAVHSSADRRFCLLRPHHQ